MNQLILWVVKHLPKPLQNIYFKYEKGLLYCFYGALTTLVSMITKLVPMYFLGEGKLSVLHGVLLDLCSDICIFHQ